MSLVNVCSSRVATRALTLGVATALFMSVVGCGGEVSPPRSATPSANLPKPAPASEAMSGLAPPTASQPAPVANPVPWSPVVTPAPPPADNGRRTFLQQEIARLQAAIQQDEDYIARSTVGAGLFSGVGEALNARGNRSDDSKDAALGGLAKGVGQGMANKIAQDQAAAQGRIQANRQLLRQHQAELNSLPVPSTAPSILPVQSTAPSILPATQPNIEIR
jgi:hypothetical protein